MADISAITLPSGTTYNLKDSWSREKITSISSSVGGTIVICGKTTTQLTDNSTTKPVVLASACNIRGTDYSAGANYTPVAGDAFFVEKTSGGVTHNLEYVYDGTYWHEFGDLAGIGTIAYKKTASVTVTPHGSITGTLTANVLTSTVSYQPSGTVSVELSSNTVTSTGKFTPSGTINVTLNNPVVTMTASYQPSGTVDVALSDNPTYVSSWASPQDAASTDIGAYKPTGSVSAPTIGLKSGTGKTGTIKNPTAKKVVVTATQGSLPSCTLPQLTAATCTMPQLTVATCTMPTYTAPQCTMPTYTAPECIMPTYTAPQCTLPDLTASVSGEILTLNWADGSYTPGTYSAGSYTSGSYSAGSYTSGTYTPGTYTPASWTSGTYTPATWSSGSFSAGSLPTFTSGDSITTVDQAILCSVPEFSATQPTFTGDYKKFHVEMYYDHPELCGTPSFTGSTSTISAKGATNVAVNTKTFTGTTDQTVSVTGTYITGVKSASFTGTTSTLSATGTPQGSITATLTGTQETWNVDFYA